MPIEDWLDFMPDSITVAPVTGRDAFGKPIYGPGVTYTARIVGKSKVVVSALGTEKVSVKTVYVATRDVIKIDSKVTMPAGEEPPEPPILAIGTFPDQKGIHHSVLFL